MGVSFADYLSRFSCPAPLDPIEKLDFFKGVQGYRKATHIQLWLWWCWLWWCTHPKETNQQIQTNPQIHEKTIGASFLMDFLICLNLFIFFLGTSGAGRWNDIRGLRSPPPHVPLPFSPWRAFDAPHVRGDFPHL